MNGRLFMTNGRFFKTKRCIISIRDSARGGR